MIGSKRLEHEFVRLLLLDLNNCRAVLSCVSFCLLVGFRDKTNTNFDYKSVKFAKCLYIVDIYTHTSYIYIIHPTRLANSTHPHYFFSKVRNPFAVKSPPKFQKRRIKTPHIFKVSFQFISFSPFTSHFPLSHFNFAAFAPAINRFLLRFFSMLQKVGKKRKKEKKIEKNNN